LISLIIRMTLALAVFLYASDSGRKSWASSNHSYSFVPGVNITKNFQLENLRCADCYLQPHHQLWRDMKRNFHGCWIIWGSSSLGPYCRPLIPPESVLGRFAQEWGQITTLMVGHQHFFPLLSNLIKYWISLKIQIEIIDMHWKLCFSRWNNLFSIRKPSMYSFNESLGKFQKEIYDEILNNWPAILWSLKGMKFNWQEIQGN
jgi:hypothetical protein